MEDLHLEHAFLKAPSEALGKSFRSRKKLIHKDLDALAASVAVLGQTPSHDALAAAATRLAALKGTLDATRARELAVTQRASIRLHHLASRPASRLASRPQQSAAAPQNQDPISGTAEDVAAHEDAARSWDKTRLHRMLVDYMLREGMYEPAELLAKSEHIEDLVDLEIFASSRTIIAALRAQNCTPALRWCSENKRRLSRFDSSLEFHLRLQEFVELARSGDKTGAIRYVRTHLSTAATDCDKLLDVQRSMALLAFGPNTSCLPYKDLYAADRWEDLIHAFNLDNYRLHGLPRDSLIEVAVKAGLATFKTRQCGVEETANPNCPTCIDPFRTLSRDLPRAHHDHSILVCSISKCIMDENNPPMALPNGNVYGHHALLALAGGDPNGIVVDPRTGISFPLSDARKCFIM
jgi:macrophage erythroblast attacher